MSIFDTGLNIEPNISPMGFTYGNDCFGPVVENRTLDAIRSSLLDPHCAGPETVYTIAMNVGKKQHERILKKKHLLFGVVTYARGRLGEEPIRSQGHIHKKSAYGGGWSTPEVYQIWSGKAIIYMQETAEDDPGKCYAVYAEAGDVIIVPPGWAHATISADPNSPLTFGAWCDYEYGFEYDKVRAHNGLAWYPLLDKNGKLSWLQNSKYQSFKLIEKKPENYFDLGVKQQESIYQQFETDNDLFDFVPKPQSKVDVWEHFIP